MLTENDVRRLIQEEKRGDAAGCFTGVLMFFLAVIFGMPVLYLVVIPFWAEATQWDWLLKIAQQVAEAGILK